MACPSRRTAGRPVSGRIVISAGYSGKCPGCGNPIEEGDAIGLVDGDWCCEDCVDENGEALSFDYDEGDE